jgi:hypothetical protein
LQLVISHTKPLLDVINEFLLLLEIGGVGTTALSQAVHLALEFDQGSVQGVFLLGFNQALRHVDCAVACGQKFGQVGQLSVPTIPLISLAERVEAP